MQTRSLPQREEPVKPLGDEAGFSRQNQEMRLRDWQNSTLFNRFRANRPIANKIVLVILGLSFLFTQGSTLEASRARPRVSAATENVRLSIPHELDEVSENGLLGLDLEEGSVKQAILSAGGRYIASRRQSRHGQVKPCDSSIDLEAKDAAAVGAAVSKVYCEFENERLKKGEPLKRTSKSQKREMADALLSEHWDAVSDIAYPTVVGIVGSIDTKSDLLAMGRTLGDKSECVGSKAATAIAYKLEEHFPDIDAVDVSRKLYAYAAHCGNDFAAAKAAYRLGLLDIWQNQCERVPQLMKKVEESADAGQFHSRAKYWRAYCGEVLGQKEVSLEAREQLLFDYPMSFHNLAANAGQEGAVDWVVRSHSPPLAMRSLVRPELNGLIRAIESLLKLGAADLAADMTDRSLNSIGDLEPEVRLYLGALMHKHNRALSKFKIMAALFQDAPRIVSGPTMKLYFPLWYFDLIQPASGELDPLLVTALIRQESAFNSQARSRVGARGLMQLMPATAKMMSKVSTSKLFDPQTNVSIGTQYLRKRLAQYNGDVELTLAAYNAGFAKVDEWRKRYPTQNRILFIDLIPYRETRDYVASILRNYFWYTKLYGFDKRVVHSAKPSSATARDLAQVLPPQAQPETSLLSGSASPNDAYAQGLKDTYKAITRAQAGLVNRPRPGDSR